MREEQGADSF